VKIQRPNIRKQIAEDFEVLAEIAAFLDHHTEIGERLRSILNENAPVPARLAALLARLDELDFHESPSIVSGMEASEPA